MDLKSYLAERTSHVEHALSTLLEGRARAPELLQEAMEYSLCAGGKRLRPILAIAGAEAVGGTLLRVLPFACALEMIHTYSLIHDDLPAMDDDSLRRGRPTNHKVYGEALAILAGDALLTEAFAWMSRAYAPQVESGDLSAVLLLEVIGDLATAAGMSGMVGGQVIDLAYEGESGIRIEQLEALHRLKTGALLEASVAMGAKLAGASGAQIEALRTYGAAIGLAFQIADDILDIEGSAEIGKDIGSDEARGKVTYPALLGLEKSKILAREWIETAIRALEPFGSRAEPLRQLAHYIVERTK